MSAAGYALRDVLVTFTPVGHLMSHHLLFRSDSPAEVKRDFDRVVAGYRAASWRVIERHPFVAVLAFENLLVMLSVVNLTFEKLDLPFLCPN